MRHHFYKKIYVPIYYLYIFKDMYFVIQFLNQISVYIETIYKYIVLGIQF